MKSYHSLAPLAAVALAALLIAAVVPAAAVPSSSESASFDTIDAYVQDQMQRSPIPGLAYGIVKGGEVIHLQAFGVADSSGRPVTPQTPFVISSISKTFSGLAVRQQINAGNLELDAPVLRYIPWFRVVNADASTRITVRMLLNHKSGFGRRDGERPYLNDTSATLEGLVRSHADVPLRNPPGTYEYSNLNDLVIGLIIEQLSGLSYDDYVQRNIFEPLRMRNSYTSQPEAERHGLAVGHRLWYGMPIPTHIDFPVAMHPAGYLISSAEDMARYMTTYYTDGRYGDVSIIVPSGVPAPEATPNAVYDGYWTRLYAPITSDAQWNQSGGSLNYNSDLLLAQGQRLGVIVLTNSRPDTLVNAVTAYDIANGITRLMQGQAPPAIGDNGFLRGWLILNTILLLLAAFASVQLLRLPQWLRRIRGASPTSSGAVVIPILDLLVVLLILAGVPAAYGLDWPMLIQAAPDISLVLIVSAGLLLAVALIKLAVLLRRRYSRHPHRAHPVPA